MEKIKKVPDIRFKGFSDEWEETNLGMVASEYDYGLGVESTQFDGINKYLRITDIDDKSRKFCKLDLKSPKFRNKNNKRYILNEGDIVFARTGASTGKTYLYDKRDGLVYFAGFLIRAKVNKSNSAKFIFYKTLNDDFNNFIKVTSQRSGQPGINAEEYKTFVFNIASSKEQTQIGEFFKNLDEKLELEKAKHEKLHIFKKAMLDDMFPKEGEKVPKIRFEGFTDEWEKVCLDQVGTASSGYGFPINEQGGTDGVPYIKVSDMNSLGNKIFINEANNYVTKAQIIKNGWKEYNNPSIIFAKVGAAVMLDRKRIVLGSFLIDNNMMSFTPFNSENIYFLKLIFDKIKLSNLVQTGALPSLSSKDIYSTVINITSPEEQALIGNFFKNLDDKIELSELKIEKIENFKQAMLEKMFV